MSLVGRDSTALSVNATQANLGIVIAFPILACIAVVLRFFCKRVKANAYGLDDWLILAAVVWIGIYCSAGVILLTTTGQIVHLGQAATDIVRDVDGKFGHPQTDISRDEFQTYVKASLAGNVLYPTVITLARCSITYFTMKIFTIPTYRIIGFALLGLDIIWWIFAVAFYLGRCTPISQAWNTHMNGSCVPVVTVIISVASVDMVCDLFTFVLPLPFLWRLQMSKVPKAAVTFLLLLGFIIIAIASARIATGVNLSKEDFSAKNTVHADLYFVESSLLIIIACLPTMKPILDAILPASTANHLRSWRDKTFATLQIQKVDRKTGLPVRIYGTKTTNTASGPATLLEPMSSRQSVSKDADWAKGASGLSGPPPRAETAVHAEPVLMPRSGFDPLPRYHELRREASVPQDEILITQEVEVSFV